MNAIRIYQNVYPGFIEDVLFVHFHTLILEVHITEEPVHGFLNDVFLLESAECIHL